MESPGYSTVTLWRDHTYDSGNRGREGPGCNRCKRDRRRRQWRALKRLFLGGKVESFDPPKHLVLAGRSGENHRRRGTASDARSAATGHRHPCRCLYIDGGRMRCCLSCASGCQGEADWQRHRCLRPELVFVGEPTEIARRKTCSSGRSVASDGGVLSAQQESNRLTRREATGEKVLAVWLILDSSRYRIAMRYCRPLAGEKPGFNRASVGEEGLCGHSSSRNLIESPRRQPALRGRA